MRLLGGHAPEPVPRWKRVAAEGIDGLLGFVVTLGVWRAAGLPLLPDMGPPFEFDPQMDAIESRRRMAEAEDRLARDPRERKRARLATPLGILFVAAIAAVRGRTPGKRALGLAVVGLDGREPLRARIVARELAKNPATLLQVTHRGRLAPRRLMVSLALAIADWALLLAAPSARTVHDHLAGTWVIPEQ